jgi:hypothetical protein
MINVYMKDYTVYCKILKEKWMIGNQLFHGSEVSSYHLISVSLFSFLPPAFTFAYASICDSLSLSLSCLCVCVRLCYFIHRLGYHLLPVVFGVF